MSTNNNKPSSTNPIMNVADSKYTCNDEELNNLCKLAPWKNEPKWFQSVAISPSAIMKMVCVLLYNIKK